jgi:type II secretory pathway component PulF
MLEAVLLLLAAIIAGLTLWGMYRLRRGVLLSFIAGLARRNLPIESALAEISDRNVDATVGSRLAGRLAFLLRQGWSLPAAMHEVNLISPGEVVALEAAQASGTAARLLDTLAQRTVRFNKRVTRIVPLVLYPLFVGLVLFGVFSFIIVFILPKFDVMFREMEVPANSILQLIFEWHNAALIPVALLFLWGLFLATAFLHPVGSLLWWHVPIIGRHFRFHAQARFARNLGFLLQSGMTLEHALAVTHAAAASGRFAAELHRTADALEDGVSVSKAFAQSGRWRPEILWAMESVSNGAPPAETLETVAGVLEDKAEDSLNAITRFGTPLMVLLTALAVCALGCGVFGSLVLIQERLLGW